MGAGQSTSKAFLGLMKKGMALPPPKIGRQQVPSEIPPEWNEYIPKKNRHSESVLRDPGARDKAKQARTSRRRERNKTKNELGRA